MNHPPPSKPCLHPLDVASFFFFPNSHIDNTQTRCFQCRRKAKERNVDTVMQTNCHTIHNKYAHYPHPLRHDWLVSNYKFETTKLFVNHLRNLRCVAHLEFLISPSRFSPHIAPFRACSIPFNCYSNLRQENLFRRMEFSSELWNRESCVWSISKTAKLCWCTTNTRG